MGWEAVLPKPLTDADGSTCGFAGELARFGEAVAVIGADGEALSYRALAARADVWAGRFASARLVLLEVANEIEPLCAYLGALRARRPVILTAAGADHERLLAAFQPDARVLRRDGAWTLVTAARDAPAPHPDLAVLLSTSGTTGATKLVRLSAGAIQANAASIAEYLAIGPDDRAMTTLPFHYSYGLSVVNSHLSRGASLALTDRSVAEPEFWVEFERRAATSLAGVPYTYDLLERVRFRDKPSPHLKTMTQAGGRLAPELVSTYADWAETRGVRFFVMYGQTEATARMAYLPPERARTDPAAIGVPIPGGAFRLVDEDGHEIHEADRIGELVYSGPNVMMGYAASAEDLARGHDLSELRTGDLAARDASGLYRITGRMNRFAKVYGLRIGLDEVEAELSRLGARGVAVSDDRAIHLALTEAADPHGVIRALAARYKLPEVVFHAHLRETLPTLPSGKIDYRALLAEAQARAAAETLDDTADNPIEAAFVRLFPGRPVQPGDSFVTLGGDSLNYVALSLELERALGFLPEGWEALTIAELSGLGARAGPRRWWSLRPLETEVILRALAVLAVVVNHVSALPVAGGADVLLMLAGYNLARYQKARLADGQGFSFVLSFARRIVAPYYLVLLGFTIVKRQVDVPSLLLVSDFFGRFHSLMEPFWFLENILQSLAIVALASLAPPVRRVIARDPWRAGLAFLAVAVAAKIGAFAAFHHSHLMNRTPDQTIYLLALGWCALEARTVARRALVSGLIVGFALVNFVGLPGLWEAHGGAPGVSHTLWMTASAVGLLWVRRLPTISAAYGVIGGVAAASFYIYLTHVIPVYLIYWRLGIKSLAINLSVAVGLGVVTWMAVERLARQRGRRATAAT